jgi:hypothetical protein
MIAAFVEDMQHPALTTKAHRNELLWMQLQTIYQTAHAMALAGLVDQIVLDTFMMNTQEDGSILHGMLISGAQLDDPGYFKIGQKFAVTSTALFGEDSDFFVISADDDQPSRRLTTPRIVVRSLITEWKEGTQEMLSYPVSAPHTNPDGTVQQTIDFDRPVKKTRKTLSFVYDGYRVSLLSVADNDSVYEVAKVEVD